MAFENIIGNDKIKKTLQETIKNNTVLNSYIFLGQEGIGKRKFAEEFARMILCLSKEQENCNSCNSCIKFNSYNHPDFIEIEPDGNSLKISQIREMQENIYQKPIVSNKKVFIINDADKMTEEAQNSLLKTLEEPPKYIVIILITSNDNLLLNTIKSRCIKLHFDNIDKNTLLKYINQNQLIENPTNNILDICNGSIGKVQKVKENINLYIETEKILTDVLEYKIKSIADAINNWEILYKSKENINDLLEYMIIIIYNLIKNNIDDTYKNTEYFNMIKIIENTKNKLNANCNYDMCIDELIFKIWEEINEKNSRY